jgi:hypothetical protein
MLSGSGIHSWIYLGGESPAAGKTPAEETSLDLRSVRGGVFVCVAHVLGESSDYAFVLCACRFGVDFPKGRRRRGLKGLIVPFLNNGVPEFLWQLDPGRFGRSFHGIHHKRFE